MQWLVVDTDQAEPVDVLKSCIGQGWLTVGGVVADELKNDDPVAHARVYPIAQRMTPVKVLGAKLRPARCRASLLDRRRPAGSTHG